MTYDREPYPDDLTDAQWALVEPHIPKAKAGGHPRTTDVREVFNAILYRTRTGCGWRHLPHDFGIPWSTVHDYHRRWRRTGVLQRLHDALREAVRTAAGRQPTPSASALDTQTVETTKRGARTDSMRPRRQRAASASSSSTPRA